MLEVFSMHDESNERAPASSRVAIRVGNAVLQARLVVPDAPAGIVIHAGFVERGARSADARTIAGEIARRASLASLVVELLTEQEDRGDADAALLRFEVPLLAQRLATVTDWAVTQPALRYLPVAYAAEGTAAAAALLAASARSDVRAVVSLSGRPDLAGPALENVRAPSLLVVAEDDDALVAHNRSARTRLRSSDLALVARDAIAARVVDFLAHALAG